MTNEVLIKEDDRITQIIKKHSKRIQINAWWRGLSAGLTISFISFIGMYIFYIRFMKPEHERIDRLESDLRSEFKMMTDSMKLHNALMLEYYGRINEKPNQSTGNR